MVYFQSELFERRNHHLEIKNDDRNVGFLGNLFNRKSNHIKSTEHIPCALRKCYCCASISFSLHSNKNLTNLQYHCDSIGSLLITFTDQFEQTNLLYSFFHAHGNKHFMFPLTFPLQPKIMARSKSDKYIFSTQNLNKQ